MSYSGYSASIPDASPFKLYSQTSFGSDLKIGEPSHFQLNLCQQQQQFHLKQHLQQQHLQQHQKLQQSSSQQMQRLRISWSMVWIALLLAAVVAALIAFTPLGLPVLPHQHKTWSSSSTADHHRSAAMVRQSGIHLQFEDLLAAKQGIVLAAVVLSFNLSVMTVCSYPFGSYVLHSPQHQQCR